jgi:hypothetical protein
MSNTHKALGRNVKWNGLLEVIQMDINKMDLKRKKK